MKKILCVLLSLLLVLSLSATIVACSTTAYWEEQKSESKSIQVRTTKVNGSEKYIVFAALNSSGDLIVRPEEGAPEATEAYAVVGYTGTVAELTIPSQYAGKNVTKVLVASPYEKYYCFMNGAAYTDDDARLANNPIVRSIVFGSNVTFVGAGVCAEMTGLTSVHFDHVQAGITYTDAFYGLSVTPTFAVS